jgi:hypothetical protein
MMQTFFILQGKRKSLAGFFKKVTAKMEVDVNLCTNQLRQDHYQDKIHLPPDLIIQDIRRLQQKLGRWKSRALICHLKDDLLPRRTEVLLIRQVPLQWM